MEVQQAESPKVKPHPRQCHLCRYNGVNAPGKPFDAEAANACLSCRAVDMKNVHDGVSWVSLDAAAQSSSVYVGRTAPDYDQSIKSCKVMKAFSDDAVDWIKYFFIEIEKLSDFEARNLHALLNLHTVSEIATIEHVTPGKVSVSLRATLRANPYIRAVWNAARRGKLPTIFKKGTSL